MKLRYLLAITLFATLLAGCDRQSLLQKFTPQKEEAVARAFIEDIRKGNYTPVITAFDPRGTSDIATILPKMAGIMPRKEPTSTKVVGSHTLRHDNETRYQFSWEYEFPEKWVLAQLAMTKTGDKITITDIYFTPMRQSLEEQNAFQLQNKTPAHYFVLLWAILTPALSIATAISCWRTKDLRRKWLWILFIILSLGPLHFNWISGSVALQFGIQLLGGGWQQEPYGPPIIQVGFPLGAIVFWFMHRKRSKLPRAGTHG